MPLILQMNSVKVAAGVVVRIALAADVVLVENPVKVGLLTDEPGLVRNNMQFPSLDGAVIAHALVLPVMYCCGRAPQSIVILPADCDLDVMLTPPDMT